MEIDTKGKAAVITRRTETTTKTSEWEKTTRKPGTNTGQVASSAGQSRDGQHDQERAAVRHSSSPAGEDTDRETSRGRGTRLRRGDDAKSRRKARVMISGEQLENHKAAPLRGLCSELRRRGWSLCALMVLFSVTAQPFSCADKLFGSPVGSPVEQGTWDQATETWTFSWKESASQQPLCTSAGSSSSCPTTWNATSSSTTSPSNDDDHEKVYCYAFYKEDACVNWMADSSGKSEHIPKAVNKDIQQALIKGGVDVSEVYSPPRLTERAQRHGLRPGTAMDLATGWGFAVPQQRREALRLLREHQPALITLCPPCGPFSTTRHLSNHKRDPAVVQAEVEQGRVHLRFALSLAKMQLREGRGFIFEHPRGASSWRTSEMEEVLQHPDVLRVVLDMCAFGLRDPNGSLHLKPTVIITNVKEIAEALAKRCAHDHYHTPLMGGQLTANAAKYTSAFVDAILKGLRRHLRRQHFPVFGIPDQWEWRGNDLVCRHFAPRRQPITPHECPVFDLTHVKFTGSRSTSKEFVGGSSIVVQDTWTTTRPGAPDRQLWTGTTHFETVPTILLPQPMEDYADWLARAVAHDMYQYQTSETAFQAEYRQLFPSRRILEGRGRRQVRFEQDEPENDNGEDLDRFLDTLGNAEEAHEQLPDERDDETMVSRELRDVQVRERDPRRDEDDDVVEPPPELRRELYRIHRNLGHPDDQTFCRALRHSGVKMEIIKWVKRRFECPICQRRKRPGTRRPAHLSRQLEFNSVVGIDLVFVQRYVIVNCLCWGTGYQQAMIVDNKESRNVVRAVLGGWHKFFGPPAMVVVDQGKEFASREFSEAIGEWGTVVHFIDVRSPWQNSRTERAGASLKTVLSKILDERTACSSEEFELALDAAVWCRNQYYDRSGFSPFQRVFGKSMRTPYALLSDDAMDRDLVNHVHSDNMRQVQAMRNKAMQAWAQSQDEMAIQRAVSTRTRATDLKELANGDTVYVWRHTVDYVGWVGPGVVVNQTDNGRSLWMSLRGYLIKASREQVRNATNEESLGAELVKVLSSELLEKLESGELRNYRDIRSEGGPDEPDLMEIEAPINGGDHPEGKSIHLEKKTWR